MIISLSGMAKTWIFRVSFYEVNYIIHSKPTYHDFYIGFGQRT